MWKDLHARCPDLNSCSTEVSLFEDRKDVISATEAWGLMRSSLDSVIQGNLRRSAMPSGYPAYMGDRAWKESGELVVARLTRALSPDEEPTP